MHYFRRHWFAAERDLARISQDPCSAQLVLSDTTVFVWFSLLSSQATRNGVGLFFHPARMLSRPAHRTRLRRTTTTIHVPGEPGSLPFLHRVGHARCLLRQWRDPGF